VITDAQTYRRLTHDLTSYDGDVIDALTAAQHEAEEYTGRQFELATRTESCHIYPNGRVYPDAYPVQSVSVPAGASVDGAAVVLYGVSGLGWWDPAINNDFLFDTEGYIPNWRRYLKTTITYIGGYPPGTAPERLVAVICRIALNLMNPSGGTPLAAPVTSMSVGGVSIASATGFDPTMIGIDASSARVLRRYRKPELVR
jgi:hypothetical protein